VSSSLKPCNDEESAFTNCAWRANIPKRAGSLFRATATASPTCVVRWLCRCRTVSDTLRSCAAFSVDRRATTTPTTVYGIHATHAANVLTYLLPAEEAGASTAARSTACAAEVSRRFLQSTLCVTPGTAAAARQCAVRPATIAASVVRPSERSALAAKQRKPAEGS
jgi:hypothetical protein